VINVVILGPVTLERPAEMAVAPPSNTRWLLAGDGYKPDQAIIG
jgi:hypothetical protein